MYSKHLAGVQGLAENSELCGENAGHFHQGIRRQGRRQVGGEIRYDSLHVIVRLFYTLAHILCQLRALKEGSGSIFLTPDLLTFPSFFFG